MHIGSGGGIEGGGGVGGGEQTPLTPYTSHVVLPKITDTVRTQCGPSLLTAQFLTVDWESITHYWKRSEVGRWGWRRANFSDSPKITDRNSVKTIDSLPPGLLIAQFLTVDCKTITHYLLPLLFRGEPRNCASRPSP